MERPDHTNEEQGALFDHGRVPFPKHQVKGYAARPGGGPEGEFCRTCRHAHVGGGGNTKNYWKCALVKATNGPGTDIRLKSPACGFWAAKDKDGAGIAGGK